MLRKMKVDKWMDRKFSNKYQEYDYLRKCRREENSDFIDDWFLAKLLNS